MTHTMSSLTFLIYELASTPNAISSQDRPGLLGDGLRFYILVKKKFDKLSTIPSLCLIITKPVGKTYPEKTFLSEPRIAQSDDFMGHSTSNFYITG